MAAVSPPHPRVELRRLPRAYLAGAAALPLVLLVVLGISLALRAARSPAPGWAPARPPLRCRT